MQPTGTVTLHQLTHKVPGKATKEFKQAVKAQLHGDRESAIVHLSKAVAIDSEFFEALNDLGVNLLVLNRYDLGIEQLTKAITVDPNAAIAYVNLALAFVIQKRFADAERMARQAAGIDPLGFTGPFILGASLVAQNKLNSEAEDNLTKAVKGFVKARVLLAMVLAARGNVDSAKVELQTYLASGDTGETEIATKLMHQLDSPHPSITIATSIH